jgi:hypothetical protein
MGSVREALGWSTRTIEVKGGVKDLLLSLKTKDGRTAYDLIVEPKDQYLIRWVRGDLRPSNLLYPYG